ncbi:MAG: VOC family protein, partial [Alphaproteobacteria bacterium]
SGCRPVHARRRPRQQCGWLKDRYGVSWQIVPALLPELMADPQKAPKAMAAILPMKKIDIETVRRAAVRGVRAADCHAPRMPTLPNM